MTGDLGGAVEEHRRLEAMGGLATPNQYLVHYNLGDELMAMGRLGEAIEEYRRAVTLAPGRPVVRLALAVALDRDEQVDRARGELGSVLGARRELRSLAADDYIFVPAAEVHYYRALALLERGATAEARLALRTFVTALPARTLRGARTPSGWPMPSGASTPASSRCPAEASTPVGSRTRSGLSSSELEACLAADRLVRTCVSQSPTEVCMRSRNSPRPIASIAHYPAWMRPGLTAAIHATVTVPACRLPPRRGISIDAFVD